MKWRFWVIGIGLASFVLLFLFSPRRDAEVALGLKWLPLSTRNLNVSVDAWTDHVVTGYIEVSPSDFEKILNARKYERDDHRAWAITDPQLPNASRRVSTTSYFWNDPKTSTNAHLETDATRSWIHFSYSTN
jgi:hypothetical protein